MDKRLAGIYLVMKCLGGFRIDHLEERVFLQKAIYLLQLFGVDFRFRFTWYLRGPYSKELASCAFAIRDDSVLQQEADKFTVRAEIVDIIDKLKSLIEQKPDGIDKVKWIELLSSIHYLKVISMPNETNITADTIGGYLESAGKANFGDRDIIAAWKTLENARLLS
jgi:uncharacterized protein YwgA